MMAKRQNKIFKKKIAQTKATIKGLPGVSHRYVVFPQQIAEILLEGEGISCPYLITDFYHPDPRLEPLGSARTIAW